MIRVLQTSCVAVTRDSQAQRGGALGRESSAMGPCWKELLWACGAEHKEMEGILHKKLAQATSTQGVSSCSILGDSLSQA